MLNFVHHVHYVVRDRDAMVDYIEKNFGMKPDSLDVHEDRGMKDALYKVGPTLIEITEPLDPNSGIGQHLAKNGPGVYHVAWGVDNLRQVAQTWRPRAVGCGVKEGSPKAHGATTP